MKKKKFSTVILVCFGAVVFSSCIGKKGDREKLSEALLRYDNVLDFSEGLAGVRKEGKWGFIDKTGKEVIPCTYDGVADFSDGLARVQDGDKLGFVDKEGYFIGKGVVEKISNGGDIAPSVVDIAPPVVVIPPSETDVFPSELRGNYAYKADGETYGRLEIKKNGKATYYGWEIHYNGKCHVKGDMLYFEATTADEGMHGYAGEVDEYGRPTEETASSSDFKIDFKIDKNNNRLISNGNSYYKQR